MDFFDKLGKKASEAYKVTADKTGKIARETKLKLKMGELKSQINDIYEEIGKKVYEKHVREENISIKNDLEEECTKIDVLSDEIKTIEKECLELRDKKQCPKCFKEIEKNVKFCPECGEKQPEEQAKEVEILEDLEKAEVEPENETEKNIIKEDLQEDLQKSNQEIKEVLSEQPDETKEESENEKTASDEDNLEKTVRVESDVNIGETSQEE